MNDNPGGARSIVPEGFKPFTLADRQTITAFTSGRELASCEYSFANLFIWGGDYGAVWKVEDGRLLVYMGADDITLAPLGAPVNADGLLRLSDRLLAAGVSGDFYNADAELLQACPGLEKRFEVREDRGMAEYIHEVARLVELSGRKLRKKRNLISQFERENPDWRALPLEPGLLPQCLDLAAAWAAARPPGGEDEVAAESAALRLAMDNFDTLGLIGVGLLTNGRLAAFAIAGELTKNMWCVHFEKAKLAYKGAAQAVNRALAAAAPPACRLFNREQDVGSPGLRQAKESYAPDILLKSYQLRRKLQLDS